MWRAAGVVRNSESRAISASTVGEAEPRPTYPGSLPRPIATALTVMPRMPKWCASPAVQVVTAALTDAAAPQKVGDHHG